MSIYRQLDGECYARMIAAGAARLRADKERINGLNVFPIPDGDTGDNMLMTVMGGVTACAEDCLLCDTAKTASGGMLLSARGNSGVILSQFFAGITKGLEKKPTADVSDFENALKCGVNQAYRSVMEATEGTILTVMREATEYACSEKADSINGFLEAFVTEARSSLERTPELLPVLKNAGVVDSGGAGFLCIAEGMLAALNGETAEYGINTSPTSAAEPNLDAFDENSVLEFGYCTELLLRLQHSKTDIEAFDIAVITEFLQDIGDSVVAVRDGSIVKLHVHTFTPERVLEFCHGYGEFLKVKIENMSLQHNSSSLEKSVKKRSERKKYGVVAVVSGDGLKQTFRDRGADVIVDGGQSMNPSAEDFIEAFERVNADTVFVFPNNGNIILTARQASELYKSSDVRVIESKTVGDGYAALSMLDTGAGDTDEIVGELEDAMSGVITAEISRCVRDADISDTALHTGDYIGFVGKKLLASDMCRETAVCKTVDGLGFGKYDICIMICGREADGEEAERIRARICESYKGKEVYIIDGGQDVYDYILIIE